MAWTNKRREWHATHIDQFFLEDHAFVAAQDGGSGIAARNAINDSPQSNADENYLWTVGMVRGEEAMLAQRGRELRVTVTLDARGEVAAFTELRLSPLPGTVASTEDTATVAPHRGRGLATWVKTESLRRLFTTAIRVGAKRLCVADTVGHATPNGAKAVVTFVKSLIAELGADVGIDWHGHRDRGFAVATTASLALAHA